MFLHQHVALSGVQSRSHARHRYERLVRSLDGLMRDLYTVFLLNTIGPVSQSAELPNADRGQISTKAESTKCCSSRRLRAGSDMLPHRLPASYLAVVEDVQLDLD